MSLINDALKRAGNKQSTPPQGEAPPTETPGGGGFKLSGEFQGANEDEGGNAGLILAVVLVALAVGGWFGWKWWAGRQKPVQTASASTAPKTSINASNAAANIAVASKAASSNAPAPVSSAHAEAAPAPAAVPAPSPAVQPKTQTVPPPPPGGLNPIERARAVLGTIKAARADSDSNAAAMQASAPKPVPVATPPPPKAEVKIETPAPVAQKPEPPAPAAVVKAEPATKPASPAPAATEPAAKPATPAVEWPALKLQAVFYRVQGATARVNGKTVKAGDEIDGAKVQTVLRRSVIFRIGEETKEINLR